MITQISQTPRVPDRRKSLAEVIPDWPTLKPFRKPKKVLNSMSTKKSLGMMDKLVATLKKINDPLNLNDV